MLKRSYEKAAKRKSGKLIFVVTEGEKREPQYFKQFSKDHSRFKVVVANRNPSDDNSPLGLLKLAEEFKESIASSEEYQIYASDEFWVVFDVDRWPELASFIQRAQHRDWNVAISNTCFEVWLFYHFFADLPEQDLSQWDGDAWKQYVDEKIPGGFDSSKHWTKYEDAVRNAKRKYSENNGLPIPGCTSVFRIFEEFVCDYE